MNTISYTDLADGDIAVYLEGLRVGTIKGDAAKGKFYYLPKGQKTGGFRHYTVAAVKAELETL